MESHDRQRHERAAGQGIHAGCGQAAPEAGRDGCLSADPELGAVIGLQAPIKRIETYLSITPERLEWHLLNWRTWMYSGRGVEGLPRKSAGLTTGGGQAHFDDLADASERRVAAACNAVIEGLPPSQSAAIFSEYLHAVYRFPRDNRAQCLELAKEGVRAGLERRGIV